MYFELPDKKYFSISEVSKLFNVKNYLLMFWEKEFDKLKHGIKLINEQLEHYNFLLENGYEKRT